jgi:hypothetical protein
LRGGDLREINYFRYLLEHIFSAKKLPLSGNLSAAVTRPLIGLNLSIRDCSAWIGGIHNALNLVIWTPSDKSVHERMQMCRSHKIPHVTLLFLVCRVFSFVMVAMR